MTEGRFPHRDTLCEGCGYALVGLPADGDCPECGLPIEDSHPRHRTGPPWRNQLTLSAFIATVVALAIHPKRTFRMMSAEGTNLAPRLFLLIVVVIVVVYFTCWASFALRYGSIDAVLFGAFAGTAVIALTYIEEIGVWYFSRRRGWRVPRAMADRVACYAGIGWVPAAAVFAWVLWGFREDVFEHMWRDLIGTSTPLPIIPILGIGFGLSVLWFEVLVYIAMRQVRFANGSEPGSTS